jgi:transcriptional regulatory protein LevR
LRSQAYYLLAEYITGRKLALTDPNHEMREALKQELEQVKQKEVDNDQKLCIIPKEEIKEAIGRSPDYSDMLMMRMLIELGPRTQHKPPQVIYPNYSQSNYASKRTIPTISGSPISRS